MVSGVRQSIMEGKEGVALLDDTFQDLSGLYNTTEWWPVAEAVEVRSKHLTTPYNSLFSY